MDDTLSYWVVVQSLGVTRKIEMKRNTNAADASPLEMFSTKCTKHNLSYCTAKGREIQLDSSVWADFRTRETDTERERKRTNCCLTCVLAVPNSPKLSGYEHIRFKTCIRSRNTFGKHYKKAATLGEGKCKH